MPSFTTRRHVRFTAAQMFSVVSDVESYPQFVPLCTGIVLLARQQTSDGEDLTARMSVGYKAIAESFTTRVVTRPSAGRIEVRYLDGPFKRLDNRWQFSDDPTGSTIDFFIDYEFRSRMLALLVGAKFDVAMRKISQAFESRAAQIYGARPPPAPA